MIVITVIIITVLSPCRKQICFASATHLIRVIVFLSDSLQPAARMVDCKYCCNVRNKPFHGMSTKQQTDSVYFDLHNALNTFVLNLLPCKHRTLLMLIGSTTYLTNSLPSV
jgi:hypothetical protein